MQAHFSQTGRLIYRPAQFALMVIILVGLSLAPAFTSPGHASPNPIRRSAPTDTCTVINADDDGAGSLRAMVADNDCTTINFDNDYTIYLASKIEITSPESVTRNLTIDGSGHTIIVSGDTGNDGSPDVSAFEVDMESGSIITFTHMTVVSATEAVVGYGGAIYADLGNRMFIQDSTFTGNSATMVGGAIASYGELTVNNSTFTANSAYNGGAIFIHNVPLQIMNSTFSTNSATAAYGGAIYYADGSLFITNTVFSGNSAGGLSGGYGGAIYIERASMLLENSAFINNSSTSRGGAIGNEGTITVQNSTFFGNSADNSGSSGYGGAITNYGTLTLKNTTISGGLATWQGGGVYNLDSSTFNYMNTIIANNTGGDCVMGDGTSISDNINNLVEDGSCSTNAIGFVTGDPKLGPLTQNTLPLLPASPAMDAGDNATCLALDQLGVARPQNPVCDIGAVEAPEQAILRLTKSVTPTVDAPYRGVVTYTLALRNVGALDESQILLTDTLPAEVTFNKWVDQPGGAVEDQDEVTWTGALLSQNGITYTFQVSHTGDLGDLVANTVAISSTTATSSASAAFRVQCADSYTVQNNNDSGRGSLRKGIDAACPGATILFNDDITLYLASELAISKRLTIDGGSHTVTISGDTGNDGTLNVRAFNIAASGVVTLSHLNVISTTTATLLGGIMNAGTLLVDHSTFSDNRADGIYNTGVLTITHSTFSNNSRTFFFAYGGGLLNMGTLLVQNSTFYSNSATSEFAASGGGIANFGSMTLVNSTFYSNSISMGDSGGGIANYGTMTYQNTIIAGSTGGDCFEDASSTMLTNQNNLVQDSTCATNAVNFKTGNAYLSPLAHNGGSTATTALLGNSPAIDAGNPAICASVGNIDQRDEARNDWQCDIGAFELKGNGPYTITRPVSGAGTYTFGPTRVKIKVNYDGECLTGITVQFHNTNHPHATLPLETGGWWEISPVPESCTDFHVNLTLPTDFIPGATDKICRWNPTTSSWNCAMSSFSTSGILGITRNSITEFSQWTIGKNVNPTAIQLARLAVRSQINSWGIWLASGLLVLAGLRAWGRRRAR